MSLTDSDRQLCGHIGAHQGNCIALSDRLWDLAETAYDEYASVETQIALLSAAGFRITPEVGGIPTAFIAEAGKDGPVVGFLGEYDALPNLSQIAGIAEACPICRGGNGHGCGHNLLGGATVLSALATRDWLAETGTPGRVRYYGCPAEEGGAGKGFMVKAGVFDNLDAALTWHPASFLAIDAMTTMANIHARFRFTGRAAHAAAAPHLGRSALDAVTLMNVGANYLREHMVSDARVHYALTDAGGTAPNVVQANAEVIYQIRAPQLGEVRSLYERICKVAEGAALMTQTTFTVQIEKAASNMLPNDVLSSLMFEKMQAVGGVHFTDKEHADAAIYRSVMSPAEIASSLSVFGAEGVKGNLHTGILPREKMPRLLVASTDVGDVSWVVPTARCLAPCFAVGTSFHSWQVVAQGKSSTAHKGMVHVAKIMALTAAELFADPQLIGRAKAELDESCADAPYVCPIPANVEPPQKPRRSIAA